MIEIKDLSCDFNGKQVLDSVSLTVPDGKLSVLLGLNGSGKSTLLKTALGLTEKSAGKVYIDGEDTDIMSSKQIAQKIAYMAQSRSTPNIQASRMVLHGRFPWLSYPRRYSEKDYEIVSSALRYVGAEDLKNEKLTELSGGQVQKIYIAMALAQDTPVLFMDEPTTFLDVPHQLRLMSLARSLADDGKAVVLILHDLCLALKFADEIILMDNGKIAAQDTPEEIFRSGMIEKVFGVKINRTMTEKGYQYYYEQE